MKKMLLLVACIMMAACINPVDKGNIQKCRVTYAMQDDVTGWLPTSFDCIIGTEIIVEPHDQFGRWGYSFVNWSGSDSNTYNSGDKIVINEDFTLTPNWSANSFNLTYLLNNATIGTQLPATSVHEFGSSVLSAPIPELLYKINDNGVSYIIDGWNSRADGTGTSYKPGVDSVLINDDIYLYAEWRALEVRDIGPAGGYIFYDKGSYTYFGDWRYIEAAPADESAMYAWTQFATPPNVAGTTQAVGSGEYNTSLIVDAECSTPGYDDTKKYAAGLAWGETLYGYRYWFLPSKDELVLMYNELYLNGLGDFSEDVNNIYWSSSQNYSNSTGAFFVQFSTDITNATALKGNPGYVRLVRSF